MPEILIKEESKETVIPMKEDSLTIGRAPENNVVLSDPAASARHCMIQTEDDAYKVIDLNSRNGTLVNGAKIDGSKPLADGDSVGVGGVVIKFYEKAVPGVARLVVVDADGKESVFALPQKTIGIGRLSSNEVCLAHPGVSNFHAQISYEDGKFRIQDLGSTNGTKVNGKFITSSELNNDDHMDFGPYSATLHGAGESGEEAAAAAEPKEGKDAVAAPEVIGRPRKAVRPVITPARRPGGDRLIVAASILVGLGVLGVMIEAVVLRSDRPDPRRKEARLNLVVGNASFEDEMQDDGSLPYWHIRTDTHSVVKLTRDAGRYSDSSLQVESMSGAPANSWALVVHAEDIPVDAARAYSGGFWVRTRERRGLSVAGLEWVNKAGRQILGEDFGQVLMEAGDWRRLKVTGRPPEGADRVRLFFSTYGGEEGSLWLDGAALYELRSDDVGTVRFEGPLGDCTLVTDRKGVVSLATQDGLLIRRCECSAGTLGGDARQSLGAVARGFPTGGEGGGLVVKGKLYHFSSGKWIKYEENVVGQGGSARLEYRVWPEEGAGVTAVELFVFLPRQVLDEKRLRATIGGKTSVVEGPFTRGGVEDLSWSIGRAGVKLDTSSFDKVTLKDGGRRGLLFILHERVGQVLPGTSADATLVVTPERVNAP